MRKVPSAMLGAAAALPLGSIIADRVVEKLYVSTSVGLNAMSSDGGVDLLMLLAAGITAVFGIAGALIGTTSLVRRNPGAPAMIALATVVAAILLNLAFVAGAYKLPDAGVRYALWFGLPAIGLLLTALPVVRRRSEVWIAMALFAVAGTVAARLWIDLVIAPYSVANGLVVLGLGLIIGAVVGTSKIFEHVFDVVLGLALGLSIAWYLAVRAVPAWHLDIRLFSVLPVVGAAIGMLAGLWYWNRARHTVVTGPGLHG